MTLAPAWTAIFYGLMSLGVNVLGGAFAVRAGDRAGTVIEIMPSTSLLVPGDGDAAVQVRDGLAPPFLTTAVTLSVERTQDEVLGIAQQAGWRAVVAARGTHEVIEVWIENRVLLEVLTPAMLIERARPARS